MPGTYEKHDGLSRSASFFVGGRLGSRRVQGSARISKTVLTTSKQPQRKKELSKFRSELIESMCNSDRDNIQMMDLDGPQGQEPSQYEAAFNTIPPGEEGFDFSNAGGEFEVYESFADDLAQESTGRRVDDRDRRNRVELRTQQWGLQMNQLVDAYLDYQHNTLTRSKTSAETAAVPDADVRSSSHADSSFDIEAVDVFGRTRRSFIATEGDTYTNVTLVRDGYLGSAPLYPTVAISLRSLELYRQTHRSCPRFSIQAQVRTLCHTHNVPYRYYLCEQFSIAYDVYLEILHHVDRRVAVALGRDTPNWRFHNACPPCFYKLEDEPDLPFSFLCEMDGNNSLKRTTAAVRDLTDRLDTRGSRTDYWLSAEEVDRFKDEVKARSVQGKGKQRAPANVSVDDVDEEWMDVDETVDAIHTCIDRWKNAGPEERKRMFDMFAECGIFLVACRHGHVLLICDIIKSGELAKYPLAIVNKLIEIYGPDIVCGYDIACAFAKTLASSSLGALAAENRFKLVVGSFHGHAHNRECQLSWHPRHVTGMGQADFEGCERIFNASNAVASNTRNATAFHRHQAIEQHFTFWDEDKYAALSRFLSRHYRDALSIVQNYPSQISKRQAELGISDVDFNRYIDAEKAYLRGLRSEPEHETLQYQYIEALDEWKDAKLQWENSRSAVRKLQFSFASPEVHAAMLHANRKVSSALRKLENRDVQLRSLEDQLGIQERWEEDSEEYRVAKEDASYRLYRRALDQLERLVVQRLFELSKLNMSGTGYKLRTHIAKALQRRSEAIRNALTRYNQQAVKLVPPRQTLSWKQIVDYSFLGEFDLLRHARMDIRDEDWTKPSHRELLGLHLELLRAREEIARCNNEVRRLRTFIRDEATDYHDSIKRTMASDPPLATELARRWQLRGAVNTLHDERLRKVLSMPGYSGRHDIGTRVGRDTNASVADAAMLTAASNLQDVLEEVMQGDDGLVDSEETFHDVDAFDQFVQAIE